MSDDTVKNPDSPPIVGVLPGLKPDNSQINAVMAGTSQQMKDRAALTISHKINTGTNYGFRHFTFILRNETGITAAGANGTKPIMQVELNINPEDLQLDTPYRVMATQTMGGAFVDIWGQGIRRLVLRGHTGWRRQISTSQSQDGFQNIMALRDDIFDAYFAIRKQASEVKTQDFIESTLVLTVIDRLHEAAYRVVPEQFRLLRNKARPLLHMYEASFIIVTNATDDAKQQPLSGADKNRALWAGFDKIQKGFDDLGNKSKGGILGTILGGIARVNSAIASGMKQFLTVKNTVAKDVAAVRRGVDSVTTALHTTMGMIQSYGDMSGIAADVRQMFWDAKVLTRGLKCLVDEFEQFGLFTYRGINGSNACNAMFTAPASTTLGSTPNSFEAIRGQSNTAIQKFQNGIGLQGQQAAEKALQFDPSMILL